VPACGAGAADLQYDGRIPGNYSSLLSCASCDSHTATTLQQCACHRDDCDAQRAAIAITKENEMIFFFGHATEDKVKVPFLKKKKKR
jgi:hypothetical protein